MKNYICLLRGINVSGQKKILMDDLRKLFESLDFSDVKTYVQSGNVLFRSKSNDIIKLTDTIQKKIETEYNFFVPVLVKTADDFKEIIDQVPFNDKEIDPKFLHVLFLFQKVIVEEPENLNIPMSEGEDFKVIDDIIYVYCPNGYGRSKLNTNVFERKLKAHATGRNWNTVNQLYKLAMS
ncbi:MAG: DUF1697 domain-containing protein [Melioribacteraceae bacterium]|nr:DUF1697 domain-containing protein [Melioribacteraceae bacterium]